MKLAVPDNDIFAKLYGNDVFIAESQDLQIFKVREQDAHRLLLDKKVDAALLTPLGYGMGYQDAEFRIVPETALATVDFTGLASVFFKEGLKKVSKVASSSPDDFLIKIGGILLAEKYGFDIELFEAKGTKDEILQHYDAAILWEASSATDNALDISDEWFDLFGMPLPLLAWVTWEDVSQENIRNRIKSIAAINLEKEENRYETSNDKVDYNLRQGQLFWSWNEDVEKAFEQVLQFLFFHQFFEHIPAVKVLGRE
jgi:hypothetical protein